MNTDTEVKFSDSNNCLLKAFEELISSGYIKKLHSFILANIKESPTYSSLRNISTQIFMNFMSESAKDSHEREQNITEVGKLAQQLVFLISNAVETKLNSEKDVILCKMRKFMNSLKSEGHNNHNDPDRTSPEGVFNIKKEIKEEIEDETNENLGIRSIGSDSELESPPKLFYTDSVSVSSVHTSELSSFEDDISISSEDDNGVKKKRRISLETACQIVTKEILEKKQTRRKKRFKCVSPTQSSDSESSDIPDSKARASFSRRSLPTRIRKPNSKYMSGDIISYVNSSPNSISTNGKDCTTEEALDCEQQKMFEKPVNVT